MSPNGREERAVADEALAEAILDVATKVGNPILPTDAKDIFDILAQRGFVVVAHGDVAFATLCMEQCEDSSDSRHPEVLANFRAALALGESR